MSRLQYVIQVDATVGGESWMTQLNSRLVGTPLVVDGSIDPKQ